MTNWEKNVSCVRNTWKYVGKLGNIVSASKLRGSSWYQSKFCCCNNDFQGGQTGNFDRKHNISATMFPSLPWV